MRYGQQEPKRTIVISVGETDIDEIRHWIRLEILADPGIESVKAFLFDAYQKLGEK